MSDYEKLRYEDTTKELPAEFVKTFEDALKEAYGDYISRGQSTVDFFEDNAMYLAFAKGFLAGCIYVDKCNNKNNTNNSKN